MWSRVTRLFQRYAERHLQLGAPGPVLQDATGREIGRVERMALRNNRLVVEGQAAADLVALDLGGRRRTAAPEMRVGGLPAFRLELPFVPEPAVLGLSVGDWNGPVTLPVFAAGRLRAARLRLWPGFLADGLRALPAVLRWFRHHDMAARQEVKQILGLGPVVEEHWIDPALLPGDPAAPPAMAAQGLRLSIVLPVYNAFDLLPEVLDRVERHTDLPWRLILIEDASGDARVRPFLRARAARDPDRLRLIENERNLGFIGAVNLGLAAALQHPDDPVVLLNSDAFVPEGWASRLVAPLRADPTVASVTPMSNDAELMSVPVICARSDLRPGEGDRIDRAARRLAPGAGLADAPTGVGFCMALSPAFLAQVPAFDTAFGRGYGEEVDWCQKVMALGGRHLCLPGLFVEHRGGTSFGSAEKQRLLLRNGALISARHPRFDAYVRSFIADDPLVTARLALALAWADARMTGAGMRVPVYLAHSLGGGAEHALARRIAADLAADGAAVVLRVGGDPRWQIELHSPAGMTRAGTRDRAAVLRLLDLLSARNVVYSCGVGDTDPVELPELLCALGQGAAHRIEVEFHDYLPISPSYTLLGADGAWRGLPVPGQADRGRGGRAHMIRRPDGSMLDLAGWQAAWGRLMAAADAVVVFSAASRDLVAAAYPQAADRLVLRPHAPMAAVPRIAPGRGGPDGRPVIGVLGNIGAHKGAAILVELSQRLARSRQADLVLIGNLDPAYHLARPARVQGDYRLDELPALVARHGIGCWLIPSVWPETFSFTTREALATGLPVICFDLGAQGDAVAQALAAGAPGRVVPLPDSQAAAVEALLAVLPGRS